MGPPPHNWVLEQLMDLAARRLTLDPAEIRRRNFIPPEAFPYTIASGNEYDSGDYRAALEAALEMADYPALRAEQVRARAEGRYLGIGLVNTIEPGVFDWNAYAIVGQPGTGVPEGATVGIDLFGKLTIKVGFALEGQGQYTVARRCSPTGSSRHRRRPGRRARHAVGAAALRPGGSRLGVALTGAVLGAAQR
jgi:CO/xanthine dehydrogenase Mo-binding subunit